MEHNMRVDRESCLPPPGLSLPLLPFIVHLVTTFVLFHRAALSLHALLPLRACLLRRIWMRSLASIAGARTMAAARLTCAGATLHAAARSTFLPLRHTPCGTATGMLGLGCKCGDTYQS